MFLDNRRPDSMNKMEAFNQYGGGQYQRFRQMSLDDMLLENRIIFMIGEISYAMATEVIMKMLYLDNLKRGQGSAFTSIPPAAASTILWPSMTPCVSSAHR